MQGEPLGSSPVEGAAAAPAEVVRPQAPAGAELPSESDPLPVGALGSGAGEPPSGAAAPGGEAEAAAASAPLLRACTERDASGCRQLHLAVEVSEPPGCAVLRVDDCPTYERRGLPAELAFGWRLASARFAAGPDATCEPGVFDPAASGARDASGEITWEGDQQPEAPVQVRLELQFSRDPEAARIAVSGASGQQPLPACED